ncbi:DUF5680 domain-containing protein [Anaeromicropila herbilytica]|uniref:HTH cro/C1-type domain-containing protein n=1 Tax=Anaeromicropila herbilytica TaxID=2785025 RepID=A0A7R7IC99_9FIRM|nr:DUF5680 domain-containing protein [Anaeromicropila herbilytica]BCN30367.1 hypothetical protein bsdtb5_16620 [Anaeromicropila herbilytica]
MVFQNKFQLLRKQRGFTQEDLAEKLGVTRQAVAKWEVGRATPDIDKLIHISDIFQVSIDYLLKTEESCTGRCIPEINIENEDDAIFEFLCKAKRVTYAGKGDKEEVSSRPNSIDYMYSEGNYKYIDTYIGGEIFAGEEAIFINEVPFWTMNYCGRVLSEQFSGDFLKEALLLVPIDKPYRGPEFHQNGYYTYISHVDGDNSWFYGSEEIYYQENKVYDCLYHGGKLKN